MDDEFYRAAEEFVRKEESYLEAKRKVVDVLTEGHGVNPQFFDIKWEAVRRAAGSASPGFREKKIREGYASK